MTTWDDETKAKWEGTLLRWGKIYDRITMLERGAIDIGLFALKAILLLNGGAILAMMTFLPNLTGRGEDVLRLAAITAMKWFFGGLLCAGVAVAVAYFYQNFVVGKGWNQLSEASGEKAPPYGWINPFVMPLIWTTIILAFVSLGLFIAGGWSLFDPFTQWSATTVLHPGAQGAP